MASGRPQLFCCRKLNDTSKLRIVSKKEVEQEYILNNVTKQNVNDDRKPTAGFLEWKIRVEH